MHQIRHLRRPLRLLAVVLVLVLTGCGADSTTSGASPGQSSREEPSPEAGSSTAPEAPGAATTYSVGGAHVHGLARDPADGTLYVATHEGLYSYAGEEPELVSPVIDLMGFAITGPGEFVASGHAGPNSELPEPMGLIRSVDAGRTWEVASRGGESDFHVLTTAGSVVVGFDGALRSTEDGTTWTEATLPEPIGDLALSPDGEDLLVTTESGLQRSTDRGATWEPVPDAPLMIYVEWADADTVVGLSVEGQVMVSEDGATSFEPRADLPAGGVVAFSAAVQGDTIEALVALEDEIRVIPLPAQ